MEHKKQVQVVFGISATNQFQGTHCLGCSKQIKGTKDAPTEHKFVNASKEETTFKCKMLLEDKELHKKYNLPPQDFVVRADNYKMAVLVDSDNVEGKVTVYNETEFTRRSLQKEDEHCFLYLKQLHKLVQENKIEVNYFTVIIATFDKLIFEYLQEKKIAKKLMELMENTCVVICLDFEQYLQKALTTKISASYTPVTVNAVNPSKITLTYEIGTKKSIKRKRGEEPASKTNIITTKSPNGLAQLICIAFNDPSIFPTETPNHPVAIAYACIQIDRILHDTLTMC